MRRRKREPGVLGRIWAVGGEVRRGLGVYNATEMVRAISLREKELRGEQRATVITSDQWETIDKVVRQPHNFPLLEIYSENHPFLANIHGAIVRSVIKNGWDSRAKFALKCPKCGTKYKEPVDECTTEIDGRKCGRKKLRAPDWEQRKCLDAFIEDPNLDDEMKDIIESLLKHVLATANAYFEITPLPGNIIAIYVENSANMYIATNKKGRLGNGEYFCPRCFGIAQNGSYRVVKNEPGTCDLCSDVLEETSYIHKEKYGGTVDARFNRDDIVHFNSNPKLPLIYGIPKIPALLLQLRSATAMMRFNFNNYSMSRMAMVIAMQGSGQAEANAVAAGVQQQEIDLNTQASMAQRLGMLTRRLRLLFLGSKKGVTVHPAMPDSTAMQSLEWMDWWYIKIVAAAYGVQPVYVNVPAAGSGGGYFQRMQVVVHAETVAHYQAILMKPINEELLPIMGVTDWEFAFNPIEPKNEREEAQIWNAKIQAGQAAANAGLTAILNDDGELKISGEFKFKEQMLGENPPVDFNLPETDAEPRQDGDQNLIPGDDQGARKRLRYYKSVISNLLRQITKELGD